MPVAALEFDSVSFAYGGSATPALSAVTLRVEQGERLGVIGPNGGGKSTLLKIALGLLRPRQGAARVFGDAPQDARRRGAVAYVPQRVEAELAFPLSARQAVELAASWRLPPWKSPGVEGAARIERALAVVGAGAIADRPVGTLSGGQLQRVMIARAVACEARLLLLDEPTVGVDAAGQRLFADLLTTLHRETGLTVVIVSHDIRSVAAACDRVACLARTLHFHAAPQGLTPQVLAEVFSHTVEGVFGEVHVDAHSAHACGHAHHEHVADRPAAHPGERPAELAPAPGEGARP